MESDETIFICEPLPCIPHCTKVLISKLALKVIGGRVERRVSHLGGFPCVWDSCLPSHNRFDWAKLAILDSKETG